MPSLEVNNPYFTAAMEGLFLWRKKEKRGLGKAFILKESSKIFKSLHELPCVRRSRERLKLSLTFQHWQLGFAVGLAVLWCHQNLAHPLPCAPADPNPLELGQSEGSGCSPVPQGCGNGATNPHPPAMLQLATQDPVK